MDNRMYRLALVLLLVVVLFAIYFQFTTFGTEQYWVFVIILVGAWAASKLLLRAHKRSL